MTENKREYPGLDKLLNWWLHDRRRLFLIGGFAGCGKTTYARDIPELLNIARSDVAYLAPTGKAATVLGNAQTIHSFLYMAERDPRTEEITFSRKERHKFHERLIIVDEISMVNQDLLLDLQSLRIPLIGLGDPAQLKPVQGDSVDINNPDILLTKVWRHDGGLLDFATDIRHGKPDVGRYENVSRKSELGSHLMNINVETDVVICRYNKTRHEINSYIRKHVLKYTDELNVGDRIMILKNNAGRDLANGQIVKVEDIIEINQEDGTLEIEIEIERPKGLFTQILTVNMDATPAGASLGIKRKSGDPSIPIDYAYAITCHKAQGSEFKNVWVVRQGRNSDDWKNWYYTAVTRARESVILFSAANNI